MINDPVNPFEELPEGLVDEMLTNSKGVSSSMSQKFKEIRDKKEIYRKKLESDGELKNFKDIETVKNFPTSAGVDGSYTMERMLSIDFACAAAVAVEGLTPPGPERRNWPKPRYFSHIEAVEHKEDTSQVLRGISAGLELHLSANAPHDVVLLDGSMKTPLIYLNNATVKFKTIPTTLKEVFVGGKDSVNEDLLRFPSFEDVLKDYKEILTSQRSDKIYAAVPKYTTKSEMAERLGLTNYEDRGVLNFLLKGGEYVGPFLSSGLEGLHLEIPAKSGIPDSAIGLRDKIEGDYILGIYIVYFRPSQYGPVLRIEIPKSVATNTSRLSLLFEAIELQSTSLSIMEPYPLYLADRMVKHLSTAVPAIRKSAFQEISENWGQDVSDILMAFHPFRTEGG